MEQHNIEDMLLSLQREVQSLKFLNGGAISDLVSRVNNIENALKTKHAAELETGLTIATRNGSEWGAKPAGAVDVEDGVMFQATKYAFWLLTINAVDKGANPDSPRICVNGVLACIPHRGANQYEQSCMIVKPGDVCEILYLLPNDTATVREFPLKTIM